jgi:hypothetical protein
LEAGRLPKHKQTEKRVFFWMAGFWMHQVLRGLGELFLRISIFGLRMTRAGSRKIGNLSSSMRLAASERPEILQIGSLARWKRKFPAIRKEEGLLDSLGRLDQPDSSVPPDESKTRPSKKKIATESNYVSLWKTS